MGLSVAITGVAGLMGSRLAARLSTDPAIDRLVGIDIAPSAALTSVPRLDVHLLDIRDPALGRLLADVDVVVHLAAMMNPTHGVAEMRSVNVDGTRNVLAAAVDAGVGKVVYTSSVVVYGAHPDNELALSESSPLRANPGFAYAEHKHAVERWLWPWLEQHPGLTATVLRPAIVAGTGVDNFLTRMLEMPRLITVRGHRPPLQFAHVDDVVSALRLAVERDLPGVFNVACEGWLAFDDAVDIAGRTPLELPQEVAFRLAERLWELGVSEAPPGYLHYVMHPFVASVDALLGTGWTPAHTNREAFAELVADHRPYVALGAGRRVRKRTLGLTAGIAGGTALAALALRRILSDDDR